MSRQDLAQNLAIVQIAPAMSGRRQRRLTMAATATARRTAGNSKPAGEVVKTWSFDSKGPRKYALQIKRAKNGNPCLKIVEGIPQDDGTFRKFHLTVWSEDFDALFNTLDEVRAYMQENGIRTPDGHKYDPNKPRRKKRR
jgi:hypothetical protein